jgi:hypothetical protein
MRLTQVNGVCACFSQRPSAQGTEELEMENENELHPCTVAKGSLFFTFPHKGFVLRQQNSVYGRYASSALLPAVLMTSWSL